ncbi:MAG TPA: hypothetical protein VF704_12880 [Allosphingosinicella sp.]|jgi:hypothetical protein
MKQEDRARLYARAEAVKAWAIENRLMGTGAPPPAPDADRLRRVDQAFAGDQAQVLMKKGLTGVGISEKRAALVLYTNRPLSISDRSAMPETLFEDVPVFYRRASAFTMKDDVEEMHLGVAASRYHNQRYACGASISVANRRTAGTLGALVKDEAGRLLGLTNNHVTGGCNNSRTGMQILAPGVRDVTANEYDPFTIGYHEAVAPLRQGEPGAVDVTVNTDAATFRIADPDRVSSSQSSHYDTPSATAGVDPDPIDGTRVEKVGRTTGRTSGFVESRLVGPFGLDYDISTYHNASEMVRFQGRVYFEPVYLVRGSDGAFSGQGDSGALVVTAADGAERRAVGLIFAGNEQENLTYMLPIDPILEALKVELVGGHGA